MSPADSSPQPSRPARSSSAIEREAATWLALRQGRGLSPDEQIAFDAWLAADPRHAAGLAELDSAWRAFDRLSQYPRPAETKDNPDFFAPPRPFRRRVALPAALLAAAAVAAGVIVWLRPVAPTSMPGAIVAETVSDSHFLHLRDGSEIELNDGSQVVEHFTPGERRVQLIHGEAQFTVAKDAARPFIVEAGSVSVRAVGTVFDVRLGSSEVEVLVTEGKVHVRSPEPVVGSASTSAPVELVALQRTVVPMGSLAPSAPASASIVAPVETLTAQQVDRVLAWQTSRLVFDSTPLAEAVARFNRHLARTPGAERLVVADPRLGAMRITGRIRADDAAGFVELLEAGFGVTADRSATGEIVLRKSP